MIDRFLAFASQRVLLLGLGIGVLFVVFAWVGWIGSDDARHIDGALGWLWQFPYTPQHHGEFRHFITIPAALSFSLFGISEYSAVLPILTYYFGLLAITLVQVSRRVDGLTALLAILLIASMSIFSVRATVAYADIAEAFFVVTSFWVFLIACRGSRNRIGLLLISGMMAGAGWLTRETTVALLLVYGVLFLCNFGIPRRQYWVMAGGFLIVLACDAVFFLIQTGNPLYRYVEILSARTNFGLMKPVSGQLFNDIGNVQLNPFLDPFLALLVNHELGLLFYLSPFVFWGLWKNKLMSPDVRQLSLLLMLLAGVWFIVTTFAITRYHPRYFTVSAYATAVATAIWLTQVLYKQRPKLTYILSIGLIGVAFAGIYVENRNPLFGERALVKIAQSTDETIQTDPITYRRSLLLLRSHQLVDRVNIEAPRAGSLYLYNPNRVENNVANCEQLPASDWERLDIYKDSPKLIALLAQAIHLDKVLHPSIERRLVSPNSAVELYRVGAISSCPG
jgi:4-amino-4-deoxy-L-arabinose transferase-like glycosyltransferase